MHRLDVMFNRLAWSIVVAAMILAAAIWLQTQAVSLPLQQTAVFVMLMGVLAGLWLLYSIVRSGRM
jgi:bacteriorhodopsin